MSSKRSKSKDRSLVAPDNVTADERGQLPEEASRTADRSEPVRGLRIAERAHQLFVTRGGQDGHALDDWLQAEREVAQLSDTDGEDS